MYQDLTNPKELLAWAFALYFMRTSGAKTYRSETLVGWLREAGYSKVWATPLRSSGGVSGLVVGRR